MFDLDRLFVLTVCFIWAEREESRGKQEAMAVQGRGNRDRGENEE